MSSTSSVTRRISERDLPAAWEALIRYCQQMGHGEIEKLKIQDGNPVMAEITREKVKFG